MLKRILFHENRNGLDIFHSTNILAGERWKALRDIKRPHVLSFIVFQRGINFYISTSSAQPVNKTNVFFGRLRCFKSLVMSYGL